MDRTTSGIIALGKKYNMDKVMLFGSRARGDHKDHSDYDIAFVKNDIEKEVKYRILEEIDELDTLHKIDIIFLSNMEGVEPIIESIRRDGVILMDKYNSKVVNYCKALERLKEAIIDYSNFNNLTMRDGVIQRFEITTELAWKTMKYQMELEGMLEAHGPKSVLKEAFAQRIITNEEGWLAIIRDRNATSHIYDEKTADEIFNNINQEYVGLFEELKEKFI